MHATVSPRATIGRSIAEQSPPQKNQNSSILSPPSQPTTTSETESNSSMQIEDSNPNEDLSNDLQPAPIESKKTTTTKSRRATLRYTFNTSFIRHSPITLFTTIERTYQHEL